MSRSRVEPIRLEPTPLSDEQQARVEAFRRYMAKWGNDTSGEQERSWAVAKKSLAENRSGHRKLFSD